MFAQPKHAPMDNKKRDKEEDEHVKPQKTSMMVDYNGRR